MQEAAAQLVRLRNNLQQRVNLPQEAAQQPEQPRAQQPDAEERKEVGENQPNLGHVLREVVGEEGLRQRRTKKNKSVNVDVLFDAAGEDDSESEESKTEAKTTSAADYI